MRETERGRDTGTGEKQAPCTEPDMGLEPRTRSRDSRIRPWAEGGAKPLSHRDCPGQRILRLHMGKDYILKRKNFKKETCL